jgi:hypothetical protein
MLAGRDWRFRDLCALSVRVCACGGGGGEGEYARLGLRYAEGEVVRKGEGELGTCW